MILRCSCMTRKKKTKQDYRGGRSQILSSQQETEQNSKLQGGSGTPSPAQYLKKRDHGINVLCMYSDWQRQLVNTLAENAWAPACKPDALPLQPFPLSPPAIWYGLRLSCLTKKVATEANSTLATPCGRTQIYTKQHYHTCHPNPFCSVVLNRGPPVVHELHATPMAKIENHLL